MDMAVAFRPSHADATYQSKYGIQARSGGGRASARETIGRVAAGAIAKQLLRKASGTEVLAWVKRIHSIEANGINPSTVSMDDIEANIVRCPDAAVASQMIERIEAIGRDGDSCGDITALAKSASNLSKTGIPRPMAGCLTTHSMTPPQESPSRPIASMRSIIWLATAASGQRTILASMSSIETVDGLMPLASME